MSDSLPKKLKHDAIVDAVFEIRFEPPSGVLPEVFYGRLADNPTWKNFQQKRLPSADVPAFIRRTNPELKYEPAIQLFDKASNAHVRFGPNVISYSRLPPYPGWDVFGKEIADTAERLFAAIPGIAVTRLGFRYINALRSDLHYVEGADQLKITLKLGSNRLRHSFNLTYIADAFDGSAVTVRIATADLTGGSPPENTTMAVDIDVSTKEEFKTADLSEIKQWADRAHTCEKTHFFALLTDDVIAKLKEDE